MSGTKFDQGKIRMELLSPHSISGMASVFTFGAQKYGDRNWEKGIQLSRLYGALQRHMSAFWMGEDLDPESGLSHLDHAQCCLHMMRHLLELKPECDDRPEYNK